MNVFIVNAHHEPESFNGALTRTAGEALEGAGHTVVVSDLFAMGFDPVSESSPGTRRTPATPSLTWARASRGGE